MWSAVSAGLLQRAQGKPMRALRLRWYLAELYGLELVIESFRFIPGYHSAPKSAEVIPIWAGITGYHDTLK